jgi:LysR family hca operon transcriptional activator
VELTAAGRAFLDHARLALSQVDAAREAALRAVHPVKHTFAMGFLTGQEMEWLPAAMHVLRDELPNIEVSVSSQYSPELANALMRGKLDVAFMRAEADATGLTFETVAQEPLVVVIPSDHRFASRKRINSADLVGETFINVSNTAPTLRKVIDEYLRKCKVDLPVAHEVDNLAMAMSLVASTRGVALLPAYAQNFLPWSVVSRPLSGEVPTIDLAVGYRKSNPSATLRQFVSRLDELASYIARKPR